ncbi:hypothetical protein ACWD1Y_44895 [Streptomyces sp. NPDC002814]
MGDGDRREVRQQVRSGKGSVNTLAAGDVGDVHVTNNYYRAKWAGAIAFAMVVVFGVVYHLAGDPDVRDAFASGPPLRVTVQTRDSVVNHNGAWFFPGRLLSAGQTLHTDQMAAVMSKRSDKVDTYETTTLVTLEGNRSHTVDITGIHIKVRSKVTPAPGGTLLVYPSQGEDTNIKIGFNLDDPVLVPRNADREGDAFGGRYFDDHSVSVKEGEIVRRERSRPAAIRRTWRWAFSSAADSSSTFPLLPFLLRLRHRPRHARSPRSQRPDQPGHGRPGHGNRRTRGAPFTLQRLNRGRWSPVGPRGRIARRVVWRACQHERAR